MDMPLADYHAVEETLRYIEEHPEAKYEELVQHLSWYWNGGQSKKTNHSPKEWMIDWIKCLTGEYNYEDFSLRRSYASGRSSRVALLGTDD